MKRLIYFFLISFILLTFGSCKSNEEIQAKQESVYVPTKSISPVALFDVQNAQSFIVLDETVVEESNGIVFYSDDGRTLFQYQKVNQNVPLSYRGLNLIDQKKYQLKENLSAKINNQQQSSSRLMPDFSLSGSNLLKVDSDGNARIAIHSNEMLKVKHLATDPTGEYLYLALETGLKEWDGNDYLQFIARENCTIYKVSLIDNSKECVQQGVALSVATPSASKAQNLENNPLQFDDLGNLYYLGSTIIRKQNQWEECIWSEAILMDQCELMTDSWIEGLDENRTLYKLYAQTGMIEELTGPDVSVLSFATLPSGDVAFFARDSLSVDKQLYLLHNGAVSLLTTHQNKADFLAIDKKNTVLWSSGELGKFFFARSAGGGVIERAVLDGDRFTGMSPQDIKLSPSRLIIDETGEVYVQFQGMEYDPVTGNGNKKIAIYQILPYNAVAKFKMEIADDEDWDNIQNSMPFQIIQGLLFYIQRQNGDANLNKADVIKVVDLNGSDRFSIFDGKSLQINNWTKKGARIYFSGLDTQNLILVSGYVDAAAIKKGAAREVYLKLQENAYSGENKTVVSRYESLWSEQFPNDDGSAPFVKRFYADSDNINSISLEFSKPIDKGSIERSLYLRDAEGNDWNYMKFWASQTLHMIPDLDISGLLDEVTTPLNYQTHYQLGFLPGAVDLWGTSLDDLGGLYPMGKQFITRPEIGWYVADSNSDNLLLSDGKLVKYAGIGMDQQPKNVYDLETSLPKNFRIEFSAINYAEGGVEITVMNTKKQPTYSPWTWNGVYLNANLGQVSYLDYQSHTTGDLRWISADTALIFAGKWQRYRIDVFEGDIRFYFNDSDPFIDSLWKEITSLSVTDASFRDGLSGALGGDYTVLFKVNKQLGLDNIKLIELTRDIYFSLDQTLKSDIVLDYDFNEFNFIDEVDFLKNIVSENKEFFYVAPHSEGHKANPVYIESETLHAGQVSTGDTSYYVFNLNGQGQGTFDVSLLNIDPNLSSDGLSIYHYQYSVTKSNQVGICEKTDEKSCQIEIKNSWENQILAIENQTQFDLTFQLLVMPSYLNPAVVELDLVTRGQIPENYLYSYYQFTTQEAGDYQLHFDFYDSENRYIDIYYNPDFTGWINNAVAPWNQDSFEIRLEGLKENTTFYFTVGYSPIKQSFDMTITRQDIVGPSFD